jgi:hypothetical protein
MGWGFYWNMFAAPIQWWKMAKGKWYVCSTLPIDLGGERGNGIFSHDSGKEKENP